MEYVYKRISFKSKNHNIRRPKILAETQIVIMKMLNCMSGNATHRNATHRMKYNETF